MHGSVAPTAARGNCIPARGTCTTRRRFQLASGRSRCGRCAPRRAPTDDQLRGERQAMDGPPARLANVVASTSRTASWPSSPSGWRTVVRDGENNPPPPCRRTRRPRSRRAPRSRAGRMTLRAPRAISLLAANRAVDRRVLLEDALERAGRHCPTSRLPFDDRAASRLAHAGLLQASPGGGHAPHASPAVRPGGAIRWRPSAARCAVAARAPP